MAQELDWGSLPFGYVKTDYNVRCYYRDGKWGPIEVSDSDTINIHMAATALHYGQEIFEGLKAFRGVDGKIRIFRLEENAKRMRSSAEGLLMQPLPEDIFREMCLKVVKLNERFVPPYGTGASLYIRPLEIGLSPRVGVKEADEYLFLMLVTPVGPYFKGGFQNTNICIMRGYDRVAPLGTGRFKCGGNYAASLASGKKAHDLGYSAVLFLDPKEKKYLDECGPANFYAIKDGKYKFGTKCVLCMGCSFGCPEDAVHVGLFKFWKVNGSYRLDELAADESVYFPLVPDCAKGIYRLYKKYYREADKMLENAGIDVQSYI